MAEIAKAHKLLSMIDSTFGTPINQHPAEYGIDLVMHSGTKYLAGHSDLICGVVAGRHELMEKIWETRTTLGNCMDPHASWMLLRGMKTLAVRVARQNENAARVAEFLLEHAKVRSVHYPFLKSHPQYGVAREQMRGGGGMVSFEVEGTGEDARRASEAMRLFTLAPSLGGVESLVSIPVLTSHAMVAAEERQRMGVTEQLIRLSVGIESAKDLIADLERALEAVSAPAEGAGGVKSASGFRRSVSGCPTILLILASQEDNPGRSGPGFLLRNFLAIVQKVNLAPNWNWRGVLMVLVIVPKLAGFEGIGSPEAIACCIAYTRRRCWQRSDIRIAACW